MCYIFLCHLKFFYRTKYFIKYMFTHVCYKLFCKVKMYFLTSDNPVKYQGLSDHFYILINF